MCVETAYIYSDEKIEERESIILLLVSNNPDFVEVKQKVSVVTIHESGSQSLSKPRALFLHIIKTLLFLQMFSFNLLLMIIISMSKVKTQLDCVQNSWPNILIALLHLATV